MNFPTSNPEYQSLIADLKIFTEAHSQIISNLGLEVAINLSLSSHDQIVQIFSSNFLIPVEITQMILSYFSITSLHKDLDASFNQLQKYAKKTGYDAFVEELKEEGGFMVFWINLVRY